MGKISIRWYILTLVVIAALAYLAFNDSGIVAYYKVKTELDTLRNGITTVTQENEQLAREIDSLEKKIPAKIERIAREKYNMSRPGEKVIEVEEK